MKFQYYWLFQRMLKQSYMLKLCPATDFWVPNLNCKLRCIIF